MRPGSPAGHPRRSARDRRRPSRRHERRRRRATPTSRCRTHPIRQASGQTPRTGRRRSPVSARAPHETGGHVPFWAPRHLPLVPRPRSLTPPFPIGGLGVWAADPILPRAAAPRVRGLAAGLWAQCARVWPPGTSHPAGRLASTPPFPAAPASPYPAPPRNDSTPSREPGPLVPEALGRVAATSQAHWDDHRRLAPVPSEPGALSSAGERCLHTAEAAGSKPAAPTTKGQLRGTFQRGDQERLLAKSAKSPRTRLL